MVDTQIGSLHVGLMLLTRSGNVTFMEGVEMGNPCECGCGAEVENRFKRGHQIRGKTGADHPQWKGGVTQSGGRYVYEKAPDHPGANSEGYVLQHRLVAEKALGKILPEGAEVHHVNCDGLDNRPENLVICPDGAYHGLLHRRQRAMDACGNPNWSKCRFCGEFDDPANMVGKRLQHRECANEYSRQYRAKKKEMA